MKEMLRAGDGIRTHDNNVGNVVLCQLSYTRSTQTPRTDAKGAGQTAGVPDYMSPETVCKGKFVSKASKADNRSFVNSPKVVHGGCYYLGS